MIPYSPIQSRPIPMEDHAHWRYLLSADGQGASWRLAKLLAINSVILKARSNSIEYYYRSLKEVRASFHGEDYDVTCLELVALGSNGQGEMEK